MKVLLAFFVLICIVSCIDEVSSPEKRSQSFLQAHAETVRFLTKNINKDDLNELKKNHLNDEENEENEDEDNNYVDNETDDTDDNNDESDEDDNDDQENEEDNSSEVEDHHNSKKKKLSLEDDGDETSNNNSEESNDEVNKLSLESNNDNEKEEVTKETAKENNTENEDEHENTVKTEEKTSKNKKEKTNQGPSLFSNLPQIEANEKIIASPLTAEKSSDETEKHEDLAQETNTAQDEESGSENAIENSPHWNSSTENPDFLKSVLTASNPENEVEKKEAENITPPSASELKEQAQNKEEHSESALSLMSSVPAPPGAATDTPNLTGLKFPDLS